MTTPAPPKLYPCMTRITAAAGLLVLVTSLSSCSDKGPAGPDPTPPPAGSIGPAGGSFSTADSAVRITVPPGALSASAVFSAAPNGAAAADPRVGAAWDLGPSGTVFAAPVTLRLRYPEQAFEPNTDVSKLKLARLEDGAWVQRGENVSVNAATREITGQVGSFSTWGIWSDPCDPLLLEPVAQSGSGSLSRMSCRSDTSTGPRYTRYAEFAVAQQTALEVEWSTSFPFVAGLREASAAAGGGTVWGATTGVQQVPSVQRFILPAGRRQVYISTADTTVGGAYSYAVRTRSIAELTSGGGCQRLVFMMPGTNVTGAQLNVAEGDCQTTIQFNPDPRWIGRPLVIERYVARLLAGRAYTMTASVTGSSDGVALTIFRDNVPVAQRLPSGGPIAPVTISPSTDAYYVIEVSAANALGVSGPLPVVPYTVSLGEGGAPATAATVEVSPGRSFLVTGDTVDFRATLRDAAGRELTGPIVAWTVSDTAVARITSGGRLTFRSAGRVSVRATSGGVTGESVVDVVPGRGPRVPALAVFDSVIPDMMARFGLPGASFAVMHQGRLVGVRTYGYADTVAKQVVTPQSRFRYASLSKAITGAAAARLIEEGRLRLDDRVFATLSDLTPPDGATPDARLGDITLLHALTHTAGWKAADTQDPLWSGREVSAALNESYPASARSYARFWMGLPLSFSPGTNWSYGQIGYILAHLMIERASGQDYADYVRQAILEPSGAAGIVPGATALAGRLPDEVRYYYYPGDMPDNTAPTGTAPPEYGWHSIEGTLSGAGWVGTAADYLRFVAAIDGQASRPDVLSGTGVGLIAGPHPPFGASSSVWYGLGWYVRPGSPGPLMYHGGNTWGTANWVRRNPDGTTVVLLTNGPVAPDEQGVFTEMNNILGAAMSSVTSWPAHDMFGGF